MQTASTDLLACPCFFTTEKTHVKNMRALSDSHGLQKCNSKNIKRKITHLIKFRWVKSYCNNSDIFCFIRQTLNFLNTYYTYRVTRPLFVCRTT